jgi:hypothetical protein
MRMELPSAGPALTERGLDLTKPPARKPRTIISYDAVVQKQSTKGAIQNNQSVDATTTASTISDDIGEPRIDAGIDNVKQNLTSINGHSQGQATMRSNNNNFRTMSVRSQIQCIRWRQILLTFKKNMNKLSSQMKEITELLQ